MQTELMNKYACLVLGRIEERITEKKFKAFFPKSTDQWEK